MSFYKMIGIFPSSVLKENQNHLVKKQNSPLVPIQHNMLCSPYTLKLSGINSLQNAPFTPYTKALWCQLTTICSIHHISLQPYGVNSPQYVPFTICTTAPCCQFTILSPFKIHHSNMVCINLSQYISTHLFFIQHTVISLWCKFTTI